MGRKARRGEWNSSITRVRPVFTQLLLRDPSGSSWLPSLLRLSTRNKAAAEAMAQAPGKLKEVLVQTRPYVDRVLKGYGLGTVALEGCFERSLDLRRRVLEWAIRNPQRLNWSEAKLGKRPETRRWRKALFGVRGNGGEAQAEAMRLLLQTGRQDPK